MWIFISLCLVAIPYITNGVTSSKLTGDRKTIILTDFNEARRAINSCTAEGRNGRSSFPSPANAIPDLIWSGALAQTAKEKAATCIGQHNSFAPSGGWPDSLRDINGNKPGEIITSNTWASSDIDTMIREQAKNQFIVNERDRYKYGKYGRADDNGDLNCYKNDAWLKEDASQGNCGHYTAIIWEQSTHIGCGYAVGCNSNGNKKVLVCHFQGAANRLGAGNYGGFAPYAQGTYCSATDSNDDYSWLSLGYEEEEDEDADSTQDNSSHHTVVIAIVVVVLVVLFCVLCAGSFWFYRHRNSKVKHVEFNDELDIDEDVEEEEEEQIKETGDGDEEIEVEVELEIEVEIAETGGQQL